MAFVQRSLSHLATISGSVSASLDLIRSKGRDDVVFTVGRSVRPPNGYIGNSGRPL